jgi:electron transfer flavoprotein beta subunit
MKIVVLCKYVPAATADRRFVDPDHTTDRVSVDGLLSELDEYAVEEALTIAADADGSTVTVLTMGPAAAGDAIRRALQMGADDGVHVLDDALHGTDAIGTSLVLARALEHLGGADLVLTGMASTDGGTSLVPAMLADRLGLPHVGFLGEVTVADGAVVGKRDGDTATETVRATLPAVVSVTDQINEPRYPSFKGIMAAKKKPVVTLSLADLGIDSADVGLSAAWSAVAAVTKRPPRAAGAVVVDDGDGGRRLVEFLTEHKYV